MNDIDKVARTSEQDHIYAFLIDNLNYDLNEVKMFWSNINGLVDIDIQEYKREINEKTTS
jgi:hypothetical protein